MDDVDFTKILEPELWAHVDRILRGVPPDVEVFRCRSDEALIDALGRRRAFDALRAYQDALKHYFAGVVFQAIRAATMRPLVREPQWVAAAPMDEAEWARMFEVPWERD